MVFCALHGVDALAGALPTGPLPPKHVTSGDSRFQISAPPGGNIANYNQLGDDPKIGTRISFEHPQQIACTAAGARAFRVDGATEVSVDLTRGDVPFVNFTLDGMPRAFYMSATSMGCALTGDTKAGVGVVTTLVRGGTNAGNAGFTNFDAPQTITCFEQGRPVSQAYAIALSLGAANGFVGLSYMSEDGQPTTYEYDGAKTACIIETAGLELSGVKLHAQ
jgi:hypothetical protein